MQTHVSIHMWDNPRHCSSETLHTTFIETTYLTGLKLTKWDRLAGQGAWGTHLSASSAPGLGSSLTTHSFLFTWVLDIEPKSLCWHKCFAHWAMVPAPIRVLQMSQDWRTLQKQMDLMLFRLQHFSYLCLAESCFLWLQGLWPVTSCSWCVKRLLRALKYLWATCSATHIRPPYNQCFFWHNLSVNQELEREWPDLTSRRALEFRILMFVFPSPNEVI